MKKEHKKTIKKNRNKLKRILKNRRLITIICAVQLVILTLFLAMLIQNQPVDPQKTKQAEIIVEDTHYSYITKVGSRFVILSVRYTFYNDATEPGYSNSKLYELISVGDRISIVYYEKPTIFGKKNVVIDARTETELYRSGTAYIDMAESSWIRVSVLFAPIELIFLAALFFYFRFLA